MCGINGVLRLTDSSPPIDRDEVLRTREHQAHRGPDGSGAHFSANGRVALTHKRLAILDLSPAGAQPMTWDDRYRITYNGELYNFRELRRELEAEGIRFRTDSDTEVILALYSRHGVAMLSRLRGMYAFALWDERAGSLLLARDPFGIKPLYYSIDDGLLRFASQVRALVAGGGISRQVDLAAIAGFLVWGSVPEPATLLASVRSLPAGHFLLVEDGECGTPVRHYRPDEAAAGDRLSLPDALADSVAAHLVSDVPVAVFLSAGLDSSLVAALARRGQADLATLTVRFPALRGTEHDEGPLAARVAEQLGTRHQEIDLSPAELRAAWPAALAAMDQPSIDGFNTFVIARAAHEAGFKVVLSGLGGDELLGGYPSFREVPWLMLAARLAGRVPGMRGAWNRLASGASRPKLRGVLRYGDTLAGAYLLRRGLFLPEELPGLLGDEAVREAVRLYDPLADAAASLAEPAPPVPSSRGLDAWYAVHRLETTRYLRNQLLRDSDWAAMASSVELRVPLVDPVLRSHAARADFAPARRRGKAAAVRQAAPELPLELFTRRKTGFYVPVVEALAPETASLSRGARSRWLALQALREHGVELPLDRRVDASTAAA